MHQPPTRSNTKRLLMTAADDDTAAAVATAGCSDDGIKEANSITHT